MRTETFKMERPGLVEIGQQVDITEIAATNYSYMIEPAVAMSGVFSNIRRIKSKTGIITDIRKEERGYYVDVQFDE